MISGQSGIIIILSTESDKQECDQMFENAPKVEKCVKIIYLNLING